jgi:hypothetical protein
MVWYQNDEAWVTRLVFMSFLFGIWLSSKPRVSLMTSISTLLISRTLRISHPRTFEAINSLAMIVMIVAAGFHSTRGKTRQSPSVRFGGYESSAQQKPTQETFETRTSALS